ncbi:pentatricopeptide repeat domain-containing protein [Colletotrichum graminicola]|uniref:Pentatricopeptide repeat domain-containing protein n=1 Tax=Colletotrichum graminicola (strain M1.001 / M2 / FGSC 10212) TaxID=645133 RepID=E3QR12_COLGM|nr:pentatricopeptide repeat domain-containing protein [Colletotrichum graminicola M1.001]EFQ33300.1 pentatricopeptide repeat domain-containing protein [Colletotrichum graminicola M1.001]WDK15710.1 pentatricopeptide repeat domain-containing protein [Colletotrichum graminicola]
MLSCKACLRHALQPIASKSSFTEASATITTLQHGLPLYRQLQQRSHTTAAGTAFLKEARKGPETPQDDEDIIKKNRRRKLEWAVDQHLKYIDDPFKIAQQVEATLKKDRFDEALLLVHRAGKTKQVVVAWNHLIEYQIRDKKRVNAAIKLYNDMKKRGQLPNDRTYTILLSGCAKSPDPKAAVPKAVALYNSLLKETSRVRANSFHLNAVLQVCGRAGDVDAMFSIAETADGRAGRKTTAYTYTAIINTLRAEAESPANQKDRSLQETADATAQTIKRCKAIWEEVLRNWRKGTLDLDEDLVCAMARVLLLGGRKEKAEIMPLLEQTLSVRDMTREKPDKDYPLRMNEGMKGIATADSAPRKPVPSTKPRITYAVPRGNTLSLVLELLCENKQAKLAVQYWELFVYYYGLEPDSDNWHQLIRIYERNGSSRDAAKAVLKLPDETILPMMYRRALSACIKDNMNQAAFENANLILDKMTSRASASKGATPLDVRALHLYLKAAMVSHFHFRKMAEGGKVEEAKRAYGEQLATAVNKLWAPFTSAKDAAVKTTTKAGGKLPSKPPMRRDAAIQQLVELARNMVGAVDKVVNENRLADDEAVEKLKQKRNDLNRFVVEFTDPNQQKEDAASDDALMERAGGTMWEI